MNREKIYIALNKSIASVGCYISSLKKRGLIEYIGSDRAGGYYIITEKKEEK